MAITGQGMVVLANLFNQPFELGQTHLGLRRDAGQLPAFEPSQEVCLGQVGQQHLPRGRGMGGQASTEVQAIGQVPDRLGHACAACHDHTLIAIEHHRAESRLRLRGQTVEGRLQGAR